MIDFQTFLSAHPFAELAVIIALVIAISYIMKLLKQPLLIGYIFAGIIIGPTVLGLLQHTGQVETFSQIGIALLLFMVGLGLNPSIIKDLGKPSLVVGIGQVVFTTGIGFFLALVLGFEMITSAYIAIALAFSSTIIIVKLLSDKGALDELYGKISSGMLIVQDLIAMILLMVLSSLPVTGVEVHRGMFSAVLIGKMIAVAVTTVVLTRYVLPHLLKSIAKSTEFLLIFAIGRCLIFAASMELIGFSLQIGALLAGLSLASLPYRFEIGSRIKPLRDFFIMLFFVFLGSQLQFSDISSYVIPIIIFSVFVLLGNPLIVMVLMGVLGYKRKNGMMVGFTVAQISEFSFILMALAFAIGHITDINIVSMVTIIGLITIAGSSYYFTHAEFIYRHIKDLIKVFERKSASAENNFHLQHDTYEIIVFGNHRTGTGIVDMLIKNQKKFIIIDYDPGVISQLQQEQIPCRYADASDIEVLDELHLHESKMIVSTIHDYETNALILSETKKVETTHIITILSANNLHDAEALYAAGANYVIIPHIVSGQHTAMLIETYQYDIEKYTNHKFTHYVTNQ